MSISPILKARRQKEKDALKKKILTVAKKIAVKDGWDGVTIRRIAAEIQYSLPVIYSHFKDKAEIIFLISEEGYEKLSESIQQIDEKQETDVKTKAVEYANAYFNFGIENIAVYQAMYGESFAYKRVSTKGEELYNAVVDKFQGMVTDPSATLNMIWSNLHGLVSLVHLQKISADQIKNQAYIEKIVDAHIS